MTAKDFITFKCVNYKEIYEKDLFKRFQNTYQLCGVDIKKFCLVLRKGFHPNDYINGWNIFNKTSLLTNKPENEKHHKC